MIHYNECFSAEGMEWTRNYKSAIKPCHPKNKTENKSTEINALKKGKDTHINVMCGWM